MDVSPHSQVQTRDLQVESMLLGRFSKGEKRVLDKALDALGEDNVDRLVDGGITVRLRDPYETEVQSFTASYVPSKKQLVMSGTRLDKETLVHEFGHALDDLAEPDLPDKAVLKSEVDPQLQKLHEDYCQRVEDLPWYNRLLNFGGGLWSDYATTNPQEYLAEGVRKYASSEGGRDQLLRDDPALASYVERFLHPPAGEASAQLDPSAELGMLLVA